MHTILLLALFTGETNPMPSPIIERNPMPPPIRAMVTESVHTAKPTVEPRVLSHAERTTPHQRRCEMCLGQHLRNYHGERSRALDSVGYRNWVQYHERLHTTGVYKAPKSSTCQGGSCSRPRIFGRFFRGRR